MEVELDYCCLSPIGPRLTLRISHGVGVGGIEGWFCRRGIKSKYVLSLVHSVNTYSVLKSVHLGQENKDKKYQAPALEKLTI